MIALPPPRSLSSSHLYVSYGDRWGRVAMNLERGHLYTYDSTPSQ